MVSVWSNEQIDSLRIDEILKRLNELSPLALARDKESFVLYFTTLLTAGLEVVSKLRKNLVPTGKKEIINPLMSKMKEIYNGKNLDDELFSFLVKIHFKILSYKQNQIGLGIRYIDELDWSEEEGVWYSD